MARLVCFGPLLITLLAFGCGSSGSGDGGTDGGTDAGGVDAGGVLQDLSDANEALIDGVCACLGVGIGHAACSLIIDVYGSVLSDGGVPDLSSVAAFRVLSPDQQDCVEAVIAEDSTEVRSFFDCQASAATDGASCYEEIAAGAFTTECAEEDATACVESVMSDLDGCAPFPEAVAECVAGTPTQLIDGLIDAFDESCECEVDPPACRAMFSDWTDGRSCLIDGITSTLADDESGVLPDALDCAVRWIARGARCYELAQECGDNRLFCSSIGTGGFSLCVGVEPLFTPALTDCEVPL